MISGRDRKSGGRWLLLAAAATLSGGALTNWYLAPGVDSRPVAANVNGGGGGSDNCVTPSNGNGNCAGVFGVNVGSVSGLMPTKSIVLPVTWANPNAFDILIDSYKVTVKTTSNSACPATSIQTPGLVALSGNSRISVGGNKSATTPITIAMSNTAPDVCKGVQYTINVAATAVKK